MNTAETINFGSKVLKNEEINSHRLDSELILSNILKISREKLLLNDLSISYENFIKFKSLILRRSKQEPVAYLLNKKEFISKDFYVDNKSLIPRPETELLIGPILKMYKNKKLFFLDAGVGTGCIMLSILNNLKSSKGVGIDICKKTLVNSKKNLDLFKLANRAKIFHKSIDQIRNVKFDLIVSNPPYILRRKLNHLPESVKKFEPRIALDGGNDGLDVIKKVIYKSKYILKSNGILALEIGNGQYRSVMRLLKGSKFREKEVIKDYRNNIRCIFSTL